MNKKLIVSDGNRTVTAVIRNYTKLDFNELIEIQAESFLPPYPEELWWNEDQLREHVERFPEGALCAEVDGKLVGSMTALRRTFQEEDHQDWSSATDDGAVSSRLQEAGYRLCASFVGP